MKFILFFLLLSFSFVLHSQQSETLFFKDKNFTKRVNSEKGAKSKIEITIENGITTKMFYTIKGKKTIIKKTQLFNGKYPIGKWNYYKNGKLYSSKDYNFDVIYSTTKFESEYYFELDKENTTTIQGMVAPQIKGYENIYMGIYGQLKYPAYARENGIQGEVVLNIKVTKNGDIEIISVMNSDHVTLTKAALDLSLIHI